MRAKKKIKYSTLDLKIPLDVVDFYREVAGHCNLTLNKVLTVVATIAALNVIKANKEAATVLKKKKGRK